MLSRADLLEYVRTKRLVFTPEIEPDQIAQVSIDLRLGRKFTTFKDPPKYITSIRVDNSLWDSADLWSHDEADSFCLRPNQLVLAQTLEKVRIPNDVVGFIEGRSSWARVGVTIHVTAPKVDPGFDATITLEMVNFGRVPVDMRATTDRPAQLMLFRLSKPLAATELYGTRSTDVFQYQQDPIPRTK